MVYDGADRKYRLSDSDVGAALLGRDYLGSITHIADSEGNLVAEYSYDAWGAAARP